MKKKRLWKFVYAYKINLIIRSFDSSAEKEGIEREKESSYFNMRFIQYDYNKKKEYITPEDERSLEIIIRKRRKCQPVKSQLFCSAQTFFFFAKSY